MKKRKTYQGKLISMPDNGIFVFGSNTEGRHGKGAALIAKMQFGAIQFQARGLQGRAYGIVTKDLTKKVHPSVSKAQIEAEIRLLYQYAALDPEHDYYIAYGTAKNLNCYTPQEMADMFSIWEPPMNIVFNVDFHKLITFKQNGEPGEIPFVSNPGVAS